MLSQPSGIRLFSFPSWRKIPVTLTDPATGGSECYGLVTSMSEWTARSPCAFQPQIKAVSGLTMPVEFRGRDNQNCNLGSVDLIGLLVLHPAQPAPWRA